MNRLNTLLKIQLLSNNIPSYIEFIKVENGLQYI